MTTSTPTPTRPIDPPCVLVVHDSPTIRTVMSQGFAEIRPDWRWRPTRPEELDDLLRRQPPPVVICILDLPTEVQRYARAWLTIGMAGPDTALVGEGDGNWHWAPVTFEGMAAGLEQVLAQHNYHGVWPMLRDDRQAS